MCCAHLLGLGLLFLVSTASTTLPRPLSSVVDTELKGTRFPPRVYSFDPRPNSKLADLIYRRDHPGQQGDPLSTTSTLTGEQGDPLSTTSTLTGEVSASSLSGDTPAPVTTHTQQHGQEGGKIGGSSSHDNGGVNTPGRNSSAESVVIDHPQAAALTVFSQDDKESSRAIVDVQRESLSGEVSYIIHPDNQPPPTYQPLKDLPPPSHPVAQWRPDIFMKVCCSGPESTPQSTDLVASSSLEVKSGYAQVGTSTPDEVVATEQPPEREHEEKENGGERTEEDNTGDVREESEVITTLVPEAGDDASTQRSSANSSEMINVTNNTELRAEAASNHTPRYEEAGSSTYQDVTNFLKDIANSDGFKNAFLGDLINNFGSLDQNAMKLIYSLLIRPLEGAQFPSSKEDPVGVVTDSRPGRPSRLPVTPQDLMVLERDRLPLRDRPANGFQPFRSLFSPSRPSSRRPPIRPSFPVRQIHPTVNGDDVWYPSRTAARLPAHGRRGDEGIDVITAPPFQSFEVVLGSSINHDDKKHKGGGPQTLPAPPNSPPLPFDKLTLGLEMPPPEALDALPPGSVLIPPSHILGRPKLPQIHHKKNGPLNFEMPITDFLPNLPFFNNKPPRLRPPAQPQAQDIPPRLPSFLSSLLPNAPPPRLVQPPGPVMSPARPSRPSSAGDSRPIFTNGRRPTGPPPPISKMTPPGQRVPPSVPTIRVPQRPVDQDSAGSHFIKIDESTLSVSTPEFAPAPLPPFHSPETVSAPHTDAAPGQEETELPGDKEYSPANQPSTTDVQSNEGAGITGGEEHRPVDYIADRNEDYHAENGAFNSGNPHSEQHPPPYYHDVPPAYINYYDLDYDDYYHDRRGGSGSTLEGHATGHIYHYDATGPLGPVDGGHAGDPSDLPVTVMPTQVSSTIVNNDRHDGLDEVPGDHYPSYDDDTSDGQPSLDDLLGVIKPVTSPPTLTEQEENDLQMLLQNHRMANTLAEGNGTVINLLPSPVDVTVVPGGAADSATSTPTTFKGEMRMTEALDQYQVPVTGHRGGFKGHDQYQVPVTGHHGGSQGLEQFQVPVTGYGGGSKGLEPGVEVSYGGRDPSIAHLWKNVQLIPLVPDLFDSSSQNYDDTMNLTSLFSGAVPLSPGSTVDSVPQVDTNVDMVVVDDVGGHVTITEEVVEDTEKADAKFMAYVLIGACCGLALLSIAGVIVIVRFKKTCGSRQIKTRTRLTEQDSIENISRRVENLTLGGESGHKLGSWFTGRNEQFGSGKLRSNMALPEVHDLKREKGGKSGSTRDLLSISSESSRSSSPRQHRGGEGAARTDDEEPRTSWLHDEYRASVSDLSQAAGQDLAYIPHQYQQSRSSPHASTTKPHPADHQRYRAESSVEAEHVERSLRERRYTGQSRSDGDQLQRAASRRGPRYIPSMDSEELDERLDVHDPRYSTDSELDDGTTHYDDDESREPSRYFSDSRELDDVVASRRTDPPIMTSQELGDHLSRDLKQYQSRKVAHTHKQPQQHEDRRDTSRGPELSSQEVEGEDGSRELQRSQSQVSFSRDNVQNEVFLEFDNIFRQHGQYLNSEPPPSTLGRVSRGTDDTHLSVSRANTPDSIDLPSEYTQDPHTHDDSEPPPPSPPTTPPRFSPPPAPPRPPKPGHLSQPGTPSPQAGRAHASSPGEASPSQPRSNQRPVYWTSEEERLI